MEQLHPSKNQYLIVLVKRALVFLFSILSAFILCGQTTNISGIVNTYHRVVEVVPAKACLRVSSTVGLTVNTRVMVIQMKGATISTANNSTFGDTTSLNGAGTYETGTICHIVGDSVFLFHMLLRSYDVASKVQLVQFGQYYSANVTDTVKAARWDSTAGTGGVIAIFADQDITLNAPIYADSSGYAGGAFFNHSGTCSIVQPVGTGYVYDATAGTNNNGAYKGESVAILSSTQDGGKGAPANGGGGGNNHNNSGGGGANLAAGGNGGGNSSTGPNGCNTSNNWGRGGKPLSSWSGQKIFMGGGGGAGHANNGGAAFNHGGAGGGIVFIWANNINGNNRLISAAGGNGAPSQADGAGGGGAGGTIIMDVTSYTGNVTLRTDGGNGGQSDDGLLAGRCFGGGAGGAGGTIYFTGAVPAVTISVAGGVRGNEIFRDPGCNPAVTGSDGSNGNFVSSYTVPASTNPAGYCQLLLPSQLLYFTAKYESKKVWFNWRVLHPEAVRDFVVEKRNDNNEWMAISNIIADDTMQLYSSTDNDPYPGYNFYRLKITEKSNSVRYSEIKRVFAGNTNAGFTIYPNPATDKITVRLAAYQHSSLRLSDISGKLLLQKQLVNAVTEIRLPVLAPGIYIVEVNDVSQKLVIR